jgi:ribonuclease P protein component
MPSFSFPTILRLKSRKIISSLFQKDKSRSFGAYPLRLIWVALTESTNSPTQAAFSVPKKTFRKANERNTLRRRMKEAYRLHKHLIDKDLKEKEHQYALMWLFTGKEEVSYNEIEKSMIFALQRFSKEIRNDKNKTSDAIKTPDV